MKLYINGRYLTQQITGVQRYSHELVRCMDEAGVLAPGTEAVVLAPRRGLLFEPRFRNIRLQQVGRNTGHLWEQLDLPRHCSDGVLFCPGNTAPVASLLSGRPVVVTVHDLSYKYFPAAYGRRFRMLYGALMPLVMRFATEIITVSESERAAICVHFPRASRKITAIQNGGFGGEMTGLISGIPARRLEYDYGLYVGSLSKRKNFPALLEAAIELARTTSMGFVFIGAVQAALQSTRTVVPADVRDKIVFVGQVNDPLELVSWYRGARFVAFPSLYEASPFPPIEAMACGCPVLASRIPSLLERCGDAALYCDPGSVRDISGKMSALGTDLVLRAGLLEKAASRCRLFTWPACVEATLRVLRRAESEARTSPA